MDIGDVKGAGIPIVAADEFDISKVPVGAGARDRASVMRASNGARRVMGLVPLSWRERYIYVFCFYHRKLG